MNLTKISWSWDPTSVKASVFPFVDIRVHDIKMGKSIELLSREARECVYRATGIHYSRINLSPSDSLLSLLLLKFKH